ncbi:unnamed protein product, partial [Durusdinium trenchii]
LLELYQKAFEKLKSTIGESAAAKVINLEEDSDEEVQDEEPEVEWTETELETTPPVSDVQQMEKMSLPELQQMLAHAERGMSAAP